MIIGRRNRSAIGTLVERTTGFTMLVHLPDGYRPEQVKEALAAKIKTLPVALRRSLTWDQGPEMRDWKAVRVDAGIEIYFCDPVRHEAPFDRAVMKGHRRRLVAAGRRSWRQSDPGDAGDDGSSLDNAGTGSPTNAHGGHEPVIARWARFSIAISRALGSVVVTGPRHPRRVGDQAPGQRLGRHHRRPGQTWP